MEREIREKLFTVVAALAAVLAAGTAGYTLVEGWPLFDSFYMTVITLGTIGYGEVHPLSDAGRVFTIVLCLCGLGVVAYAFSSLTAFIVEGQLREAWRRRKMEARIRELEKHYVVCGAGYTGAAIIEELEKTRRPFVVIDRDAEKVEKLRERGLLALQGDALEEETLAAAGAARARGVFCVIDTDPENVFISLTARGLNPGARIVCEVHDSRVTDTLLRSGADAVVSSQKIGGLRLASEMVRPAAVGFLDSMIRAKDSTYRFEEIRVPDGSPAAGSSLGELRDRAGRAPLIMAVKPADAGNYAVNPPPGRRLAAGETLVVMGDLDELSRLRETVGA